MIGATVPGATVPGVENPVWRKLLTGELQHQFKFLAAGMCFSRNIREVAKDPSEESIERSVAEVQSFCAKYRPLLKTDLESLFPESLFPEEAVANG
jgi:hypothetical protein